MENFEARVIKLEDTISALVEHIKEVNTSIATGFEKVENNFVKVNEKIDTLKTDVNSLRGNSTSSLENVEFKLDDLKVEISKINDVTGYEGMFNNSLKIAR